MIDRYGWHYDEYMADREDGEYVLYEDYMKATIPRAADSAPYGVRVIAWVHLPKNPHASDWIIAHRVVVEKDDPENDEELRRTVGCWWGNGRYYAAGYITHWIPLPDPIEESE